MAEAAGLLLVGEILKKIASEHTKRKRKWIRKWVSRRSTLGASSTLLKELRGEDPTSFLNFLRMDTEMFDSLFEKVC